MQTTTHDLSLEGVTVRALEPPAAGTSVQLRFYLPGNQSAECTATVREQLDGKESGFRAAFTAFEGQANEQLAALVSAHASGGWRTPVPLGGLYPQNLTSAPVPLPAGKEDPPSATQSSSGGVNRRGFARHRARFVVRFETVQEFVLQYAANISAGGVFVATEVPPPMDTIVTVVLELPGTGQPVSARGQIVHRVSPEEAQARGTDAGAGVQFIDADDAFREAIDRAIDHILVESQKDKA